MKTAGGDPKLSWLGGEQDKVGPREVDRQRLPQVLASPLGLARSSYGSEHLARSPLPRHGLQREGRTARILPRHQPPQGSHLHFGQVGNLVQVTMPTTFIIRFTVKLLSYERTNTLLANMTSGDHTMPADLQGFSIERIRRVRIWMNMKCLTTPHTAHKKYVDIS